ncbi:mitochondrial carrier [Xylaria bambusicola]|uniref:mitochondrial carrier n=1 Tax=Xylaria bambusicola TaxID=326684 RepID=UPI002008761E|nr:mitochondrial carrier [Xylaria bambusicola]KAI0520869.1 mitochondrial carrier [Xylaria bambusicola]
MAVYEDSRTDPVSVTTVAIPDDFWAGWISGILGVMCGNSMDRRKVQLQSQQPSLAPKSTASIPLRFSQPPASSPLPSLRTRYLQGKSALAGTAAPSLGVGVLNAGLYMIYNRTEEALNNIFRPSTSLDSLSASSNVAYSTTGSNLWTTWSAGAAGGLVTSIINTPIELIKCKAQVSSLPTTSQPSTPSPNASPTPQLSSWRIAKIVLRTEGYRGLYRGGVVTALRDSIGYGFYFWAYELGDSLMTSFLSRGVVGRSSSSLHTSDIERDQSSASLDMPLVQEALKVILCGGIAGIVTWASVYPLDVVKTRLQVEDMMSSLHGTTFRRKGAIQITRELYSTEGSRAFFRGLAVCSKRAFIVNAVQWPAYKWTMAWLSQKDVDRGI